MSLAGKTTCFMDNALCRLVVSRVVLQPVFFTFWCIKRYGNVKHNNVYGSFKDSWYQVFASWFVADYEVIADICDLKLGRWTLYVLLWCLSCLKCAYHLVSPIPLVTITTCFLLGSPKIGWDPRTRVKRDFRTNTWTCSGTRRQGISKSLHLPQKLWTPLHVPSDPLL
jgi:hypothetical protein